MLSLAQAHTLLVRGCERAPIAPRLELGGRPMPWVLGLGDPVVIAEPWSKLRALHRRKRGFSHLCDRLEALGKLARAEFPDRAVVAEVWADEGEPDPGLLEKVARRLGIPIEVVDSAGIRLALEAVERVVPADLGDHPNPLIAVLSWRRRIADGGQFDKATKPA